MKHSLRRAATVTTATVGALSLLTGVASAHYCTNESLSGKAGEAYVLFDISDSDGDGEADWNLIHVEGLRLKGENIVGGGFVDLYMDTSGDGRLGDGDWLLADNMFLKAGLPVAALTAADCDKGVGTAFPEEFELEACP
jgi:hypothetical protein